MYFDKRCASVQCAVVRAESERYPEKPPFNPDRYYPEYRYKDISEENAIYAAIRELFKELELDKTNYGTDHWNPLSEIIQPGDNVVIKPNFVSEPRDENVEGKSIMTHGSVIRPLIDYSLIALKSTGSLVVADAPQTDSNFEKIKKITKIQEVIDFVNATSPVKVALLDLRAEYAQVEGGFIAHRYALSGDPKGYAIVDLAQRSAFHDIEGLMHKAYGSDYDFEAVRAHHTRGKHEYFIAKTILDADVIINVPKLKTHKKAGITGCLKNIVGINGDKNYLPHFRFGVKEDGGDSYSKGGWYQSIQSSYYQLIIRSLARAGPKTLRLMAVLRGIYVLLSDRGITNLGVGDWCGNDTIWRTIVDINRIALYVDKSGLLQEEPQRRHFAVVDGIVGGEGNGPFEVSSKPSGVLIGGFNPVLVDATISRIMGFNWEMIPQIIRTQQSLFPTLDLDRQAASFCLDFQPSNGWNNIRADNTKQKT
jgi:uncharacterized protein (DUF362 family)